MKFERMVALITGGAQGLGKKFAQSLLGRGASVIVTDTDESSGREFEDSMFQHFGAKRLKFIPCDVRDLSELHQTFDYSKKYFGRLDAICNNSVVTPMTNEYSSASKLITDNLTALIEGTYKGIEVLSVANGGVGGVIVNVSSSSGYNVMKGGPVYTATKYGVVGFSRAFKFLHHFNEDKVRVNCICPFFLDPLTLKRSIEDDPEIGVKLNHYGYPDIDDVTRALLLCVENETMNGEVIAAYAPPRVIDFDD